MNNPAMDDQQPIPNIDDPMAAEHPDGDEPFADQPPNHEAADELLEGEQVYVDEYVPLNDVVQHPHPEDVDERMDVQHPHADVDELQHPDHEEDEFMDAIENIDGGWMLVDFEGHQLPPDDDIHPDDDDSSDDEGQAEPSSDEELFNVNIPNQHLVSFVYR